MALGRAVLGLMVAFAVALAAITVWGTVARAGGPPEAVGASGASTGVAAAPPVQVALTPADGTTEVAPAAPAVVRVAQGRLTDVALMGPDGKGVPGQVTPDGWASTEHLGYGTTYTWSGAAAGADGRTVPIAGSFTTVTPARQVSGRLNVGDAQTYGIAIPVALTFSSPVSDEAAVERALTVTTSVPTAGSWAWLNNTTVHWRPESYYQPGTQVSVAANLYGVAFAPGVYGRADVSVNFTIGRSQVVQANAQTHRMVVITNGVQTSDFPASFGLDSDLGRNTHSGTHVVMGRSQTVFMTSVKYHYTNLEVHWAVRISNNGEFIHAKPGPSARRARSTCPTAASTCPTRTPRRTTTTCWSATRWRSQDPPCTRAGRRRQLRLDADLGRVAGQVRAGRVGRPQGSSTTLPVAWPSSTSSRAAAASSSGRTSVT